MDRQLTIVFTGRDAGLNRTASGAAASVRGLGEAAERANRATGAYIDAQGRLRSSQGQLINATRLTTREVAALRMEFAATGRDVDGLDEALGRSRQGLQGLAATTGVLGGAIAGLFGRGTQEFLAFEGGIKQAGVVGQASAEELAILSEEVERLGIETSKAPAEIAQTAVALSRAGFSAQETTDALAGVVKGSEATGTALLNVGDIVAKTVRTFGLVAEDSNGIADILVATANNTNTTVSSIGESLAFVGAQAKTANQPIEDTTTLIGLLGDTGIQGSRAGTNLGSALERLQQASAGVDSEFTELVRGNARAVEAFQAINTEVRDADGNMLSLLEILPTLKANLNDLESGDRDLVTKALFGTQGSRAILSLINQSDERIAGVTETIRNAEGQANKAGEALLTGLSGALNLLQGSVGATLIKFGEFTAIGLEPLVRAAIAVLNGFLALPGPIQAVIVGTTALTGALAGAVALLAGLQALQISTRIASIANAAALTAQTVAQAANTAVTAAAATTNAVLTRQIGLNTLAAGTNTLTTIGATAAKSGLAAALTFVTLARNVLFATITRETVALGLNAAATNAAAIAKAGYAGVTRLASGISGTFGGQLLLVAGALAALNAAFSRSEGAKFASELDKSVEALERSRGEADETAESVSSLATEYEKFLQNIQERGPIEAVQLALAELTGSTGRFGESLRFITSEQRGAQLAQFATSDAIARLGDTTQETTDLLSKYGQVSADATRSLNPAQLAAFTKEVEEQAKALQEEIELLEGAKGQSEELDQQLQNEIDIRESLIRTLQNRITAQGGETQAVEAATEAARELDAVLSDLDARYEGLNDNAGLVIDQAIAEVATQQAEGLLDQAEAERQIINLERTQLQATIDNNRALLDDLRAQRSQRSDPQERAVLDDRILDLQRDLARNERQIAQDRISAQERDNEEAEKLAEDLAQRRIEILEAAQEEEKRIREEAFGDRQREESVVFSDEQAQRAQAFADSQRAQEAAFNDSQQAEAEAFQEAQALKAEQFGIKEQNSQSTFQERQQVNERDFNERQRAAQASFNAQQRAEATAFSERQNVERQAAEERFSRQRVEIERSLQLEDAGTPEERRDLQAQFDAQDAEAERRREAFAELEAAEAEFERQQREEQQAFEEAQRLTQMEFEDGQRAVQEKFELGQQQAELEFEETLNEARTLFEDTQKEADRLFQAEQQAQETAFDEAKRQADRDFAAEQQQIERDFEGQQREAERAFKAEERALDRANAIAVQSILSGDASATPETASQPTQSLRGGGIARGGVVQVHADEFLIPPRGTRVVSQQESRRMVQEFLIQNPIAPTSAIQPQPISESSFSGVPEKLDSLIGLLRSQPRPNVKAGGNTYVINGEPEPTTAATRIALDQVKAIARMR